MNETPEFSRPIGAGATEHADIVRHLEADSGERARLARRLGLESIDRLEADVRLRRVRAGRVLEVSGSLSASTMQICVVTLEPFPTEVTETFRALYDLEPRAGAIADELDLDPDSDEAIEPLVEGRVDVGELVAQHLSLALDPYPRAPGVEFTGFDDEADGEGHAAAAAFQVLKAERRRG